MPIYALCDMNSFYVSAELLFRPDLLDKPCIVLSNNDGCAVARNAPAKALGIKMGAPRFEIEEIIHEHGVITFSSNYTLYADISNRVMTTLERLAPSVFIYSIDANPAWIRKHFSVVLERTVRELNGMACIPFDDNPPHKKQIVVSRSFGQRITQLSDMRQAISSYMTKAAEKLRNERMNTGVVTIFFRTNVFNLNQPQYANSVSSTLTRPSSDSRELIRIANELLSGIWKNGYAYMKAGVMLSDFYEHPSHSRDYLMSNLSMKDQHS